MLKRLLETEKEDVTGVGNSAAMRHEVISLLGAPGSKPDPALAPQSALAPEHEPALHPNLPTMLREPLVNFGVRR